MQHSGKPDTVTGSEPQPFDPPSEVRSLEQNAEAREDSERPHRDLATIGGRCDLNSLFLAGKRYHVDLRSKYITEHCASTSAKLVSLQDLESVCVKTAASSDAILLFAWHKTLSVFAHGTTTVVLLTDERTQSSSTRVPGIRSSASIVDHDQQRNGSCLDAILSLEAERLCWKAEEVDAGLLDSHVILRDDGSELPRASLLHPITASLRLPGNPSESIELELLYAGELFPAAVMEGFCEVLQVLLTQAISFPGSPVDGLDYLSDEQGRALDDWNCTDGDYDRATRLEGLFESAVAVSPSATAVVYKDHSTTYEALNADANRIAHYVRQLVAPEHIVALFLDKSELMIAAVIGIWKSGAAYTPVDPSYPDSRCIFALQDTRATVIVCNAGHARRVETLTAQVDNEVTILELEPLLDRLRGDPVYPYANPGFNLNSGQLAYLTYTSGTTGAPKGIRMRHTNVVNSITDLAERYEMREGREAVALFSPYVFEPFVRQTLVALINSQTLIVVSDDEKMEPLTFASLLRKHRVTYLNGTASVLQEFDYTDCPDLKRLVLVGEELTRIRYDALRKTFSKCIINEYGFTESALVTAIKVFRPSDDRPNRSLGRPLRNVKFYVLDAAMKRVPIGAIGELFIGGQGVSQGYLNRPELTKERFLSNPYQTASEKDRGANSTMYRTGDLARGIPDTGEIEYLGRNDFQIKFRGVRIEPGEIESVLAGYPGVDRVVVVARTADSTAQGSELGSLHLFAYWVGLESLQENVLHVFLESRLPRYMVPTRLFHLDHLPTTINGKIDFRALPDVDLVPQQKEDARRKPADSTQEILRTIWSELLNLPADSISVNDNFFRLGGSSVTCIQLSGKARQRLGARLTVEDVFAGKTIERLALMMRPLDDHKNACPSLSANDIGVTSDIDGVYIANSLQQGFVFNYLKRNRHDDAYTMQYVSTYNTVIDSEQYRAAWVQSQKKFSALRLRFVAGDEVYQVIDRYQALQFRTVDISQLPEIQTRENILAEIQKSDRLEHYDLDRGSLFRVYLIKWSSTAWKLLFSCHHAIMDGWSVPILLDYVHERYAFPHANEDLGLDDEVYHASQALMNSLRRENLPYWREQVGVIEERCDLRGLIHNSVPKKPDLTSYDFVQSPKEMTINLGMEWKADLESVCPENEITLHSVLQFVCHMVLNTFGNGRQSVVGTVVSGRELPVNNIEAAVGLYINTLPLIVDHQTQRNSMIIEAIRKIQHSVISMNMRSTVDLAQLSPGKMTHDLFDCLLVLENYPELDKRKHQLLEKELSMSTEVTTEKLTYPLAFVCSEAPGGDVHITLRYASELFTEDTIHEILDVFHSVFEQLPAKMFQPVAALELLGSSQVARFDSWNGPKVDYPQLTLACMFEDMAAKFSTNTSVIYEDESMTYAELNTASNRLARALEASVHARPNKIVGLLLQKGINMFIAILAVWKAGMAYTPIDPNFPRDRINYILEDTEAAALLTSRDHLATVAALSAPAPVLCVEETLCAAESLGDENLERTTCYTDLAYVYFTSGTTGRPKGVMVEHRGVVNLQQATCRTFGLSASQHPDEVILSFSNYTFDPFVQMMTDALLNGQTLLILNDEMRTDKDRLYRYMTKHRVTHLSGTPSVLSMCEFRQISTLRRIECIGEDFSEAMFNRIRQHFGGVVSNGYGPTEASIISHRRLYTPGESRTNRSIGFQIDNSRSYVLNQDMKRVPIGATGDLYLGGDGVARGYLNLEELTAERFIVNPYQSDDDKIGNRNGRIYRTGDVVRWLPTGELEYLGRDDQQIKLRGQRVELGEIEAAITSCVSVTHAAVIPRTRYIEGSDEAQHFLIGYFVAEESRNEAELRTELRDLLPAYLIPNRLVQIPALPVSINGKLDTKVLPDADYATATQFEPPRTDTERRLCTIWSTLLGIPEATISTTDDFFSLGGDSLLSVKLSFLVTEHFARRITVAHIFESRTIRTLATFILEIAAVATPNDIFQEDAGTGQASLAQERLLFIDNFTGGSGAYNVSRHLRLPASTCMQKLKGALTSLIDRHGALRTILRVDPSTNKTMQLSYGPGSWMMPLTEVEVASQDDLDALLDSEARHVFNLHEDIPIRITLAQLKSTGLVVLSFNIHHVSFDAWSWKVICRDLIMLYEAYNISETDKKLPDPSPTYAQYSNWQRRQLTRERGQTLKSYWANELQGYNAVDLPSDFQRPEVFDYGGQDLSFVLDDDLATRVAFTAKSSQTTTFSIHFAAYCLMLSAHSNQSDILIGVPMANRQHRELENLVGFLTNMVAVRIKIKSTSTPRTFISYADRRLKEAQLNQDFPFEEVIRAAGVAYTPDRFPVFQHIFSSDVMSAVADAEQHNHDSWLPVQYHPVSSIHSTAKVDLFTSVVQQGERTALNFNFPTALFASASIERFATTYKQMLTRLVD
jgi:N-(5-amino-5-carboxypentanoyl)-L-cysteinyl-D-valine synthase